MAQIRLVTVIAAPIERAFDLAITVDAHEASMRSSGERAIAGVTTGPMSFGDTVSWRGRHFGIWWHLTSQITAYDRPHRFVDEQVRGPFRRWRHEHLFRWDATRDVTVMRDVIDVQAPLGPLGWVVERLVLHRYMRELIIQRNAYLARHVEPD